MPGTSNNCHLPQPRATFRSPPTPESLRPYSVIKQFPSLALYISISPINMNLIKIIAVIMAILHPPRHPLSTSAHAIHPRNVMVLIGSTNMWTRGLNLNEEGCVGQNVL